MLDGICVMSVIRIFACPHWVAHLEDNVADVEYREDLIVVIIPQPQVSLQTSQTSIANVGAVDEAEQVQKSHCGDDVEIDLPPQPGLGLGIECENRVAIAGTISSCLLPQRGMESYMSVAV